MLLTISLAQRSTKLMIITELTIDRKRWQRGRDTGGTLLDSCDNTMCCLGFVCKAFGLADADIADIALPAQMHWRDKDVLEFLREHDTDGLLLYDNLKVGMSFEDTPFALDASDINDNTTITDWQREKELIELFARYNIALSFTD
jgi:hypothetical protein